MSSDIQRLLNNMRLEVDVASGAIDSATVAFMPKVIAAVDGQPKFVVCRGFEDPRDWENHMSPEDCELNRLASEAFWRAHEIEPRSREPERIVTDFDVPPPEPRGPFRSLTRRLLRR